MTLGIEWHFTSRESQLAAELLGSGITKIRYANHAQKSIYHHAFFNLSIGLERLAKLVILADARVETGKWMNNNELRLIGHDLLKLFTLCEAIGEKYTDKNGWNIRPDDEIHLSMTTHLSNFAKATRYFNLDALVSGSSAIANEPVSTWWTDVALQVLTRHYKATSRDQDKRQAEEFGNAVKNFVSVFHHDETGGEIRDIASMMSRAAETRIVQKYSQLYLLQIVRWLSTILSDLSFKGAYDLRVDGLLGLDEPFAMFYNDDKYFLSRKTWNIHGK